MNKFMKTAVILLLLAGVTFTVFRAGIKKAVEGSLTENQQVHVLKDANGNLVDQDGNRVDEQGYRLDQDGKRMLDKDGHPIAGVGTNAGGMAASGTSGSDGKQGDSALSESHTSDYGIAVKTGAGANVAAGTKTPADPTKTVQDGKLTYTQTKPESNCFSFEYKHQQQALNKDIEDFLDYSNAFPILHDKVTEKSICVKVNNKPVAFKVSKYKNQKEVVIGSVVGPESVIKLSYCVGTSACKEGCALKSNRFMDDLMSDAGDENEFKESWGDAKEQKKELQAKVKEFRNVASENKDLQKQATVRDWDTLQKNEWVCKK